MSYSNSPLLPKARRQAVNLVLRRVSVSPWPPEGLEFIARRSTAGWRELRICTAASASRRGLPGPRVARGQIRGEIAERVIELRRQHRRCGKVIHALLLREGMVISLASFNRILDRAGYLSSWYVQKGRLRRPRIPRPPVKSPGNLVEVDIIHLLAKIDGRIERRYIYTLIDVKTRWAHAVVSRCHTPEGLFGKRKGSLRPALRLYRPTTAPSSHSF